MIASTLLVVLLYAFVSVVAAGVLPVSEIAGQPLNLITDFVLPKPAYAFFVACGAMFALISTLSNTSGQRIRSCRLATMDGVHSN